MLDGAIPEGLTFDDVLLLPGKSSVMPAQVDTRTCLTRRIASTFPSSAAAMDTVTEVAPGHRARPAGRHRLHSSQHVHRAPGAKKSTR